ncbi:ABC transporter-like protein [Halococcus salifodinae DSM 8989]|uniref:ABC transporter-like protein n=1 Tax=Halococcus salifodinae DSM 8989 TaxID=1227456 RepID=M0N284_9EURY|nr:ABC transporter-like protein [Halococcus salifodinae DSM 8989]
MSVIEFEDVDFTYLTQADGPAVENFSLTVEQGEFVGIAGPSDAGKTTVCRLIHSYIPNFFDGELSGQVTVDGNEITDTEIGEMAETVGLLFENPFDQLTGASTTVFEEVAFGLENAGVPRTTLIDRVYDTLETVGIGHLAGRNPNQLSGGQSQRLALAAVLALEPDILVLDEPTSQLDPEGTEEILDLIAAAEEEYTVVLVSQDIERIAPHLDRLVVLEDGQVRHDDDPKQVLTIDGIERLVSVPDVVRIGRRLSVDPPAVPLTIDAAVETLEGRIENSGTATTTVGTDGATGIDPPTSDGAAGTDNTNSSTELELSSVTYRYDENITALDELSLALKQGCICVIGQNGAGKSTFAKHLNGLLEPTAGSVRVRGTDTTERTVAELARTVGLNFQNPDNQLFHDTVAAELAYGPRNLGYEEDRTEQLIETTIDQMGLEPVRDANPYDIGLARRKQVAVASVVAMDTPVIVLDEPTAGQDPRGIDLLGDLVDELVASGVLVIVVTHDMTFVRDHADRAIALGQGRRLLDGPPTAVFGDHETLAETDVAPPAVTRIANDLGIPETVLTVDELFEYVD